MDSPAASLATETAGDGLNVSERQPAATATRENKLTATISFGLPACAKIFRKTLRDAEQSVVTAFDELFEWIPVRRANLTRSS